MHAYTFPLQPRQWLAVARVERRMPGERGLLDARDARRPREKLEVRH